MSLIEVVLCFIVSLGLDSFGLLCFWLGLAWFGLVWIVRLLSVFVCVIVGLIDCFIDWNIWFGCLLEYLFVCLVVCLLVAWLGLAWFGLAWIWLLDCVLVCLTVCLCSLDCLRVFVCLLA